MDTEPKLMGFDGIIALALSERIHHVETRSEAERTAVKYANSVLKSLDISKPVKDGADADEKI